MTRDLPAFVIACDFDGTIAARDVGNGLFRTFAGPEWRDAVARWKEGTISSRECLERECAVSRAPERDLHRFIDAQPLDPAFGSFYRGVTGAGWPLFVVSDGMDYYIDRIFRREGLDGIPVFSNGMERDGDRFGPVFPFHRYGCGRCGNCKKHHLGIWRGRGRELVYIGDGFSDRCAAGQADIVFAKDDLAVYCSANGIDFIEFNGFECIYEHLTGLAGVSAKKTLTS